MQAAQFEIFIAGPEYLKACLYNMETRPYDPYTLCPCMIFGPGAEGHIIRLFFSRHI